MEEGDDDDDDDDNVHRFLLIKILYDLANKFATQGKVQRSIHCYWLLFLCDFPP
jgi:hypothetical protein